MNRWTRTALLAVTLIVLVAGTALATRSPRAQPQGPAAASQEENVPPTADELKRATDRLKAQDIDATTEQLEALAADFGLGGAIRMLAWANATGMSLGELRDLRADAGWGRIARDLGGDVTPGIGWIMGGGQGRENAPGQQQANPGGGGSN